MNNEGKIIIATLKPESFAKKVQGTIVEDRENGIYVRTLGIGQIIFLPFKDIRTISYSASPTSSKKLWEI